MGAAVQRAEFKNTKGQAYTIDIYDSDSGGGSIGSFKISPNVSLNSDGISKPYDTLLGTAFAFTYIIENDTQNDFILNLINTEEERYMVQLHEGIISEGTLTPIYYGFLRTDLMTLEETSYPISAHLKAVDSVGPIKRRKYTSGINNYSTIHEVMAITFGKASWVTGWVDHPIPVAFVSPTDDYFTYGVNWETTRTPTTGFLSSFNYTYPPTPVMVPTDWYDYITEALKLFGARLFTAKGKVWAVQLSEFKRPFLRLSSNQSGGTPNSTSTDTAITLIDQENNYIITGATRTFVQSVQNITLDSDGTSYEEVNYDSNGDARPMQNTLDLSTEIISGDNSGTATDYETRLGGSPTTYSDSNNEGWYYGVSGDLEDVLLNEMMDTYNLSVPLLNCAIETDQQYWPYHRFMFKTNLTTGLWIWNRYNYNLEHSVHSGQLMRVIDTRYGNWESESSNITLANNNEYGNTITRDASTGTGWAEGAVGVQDIYEGVFWIEFEPNQNSDVEPWIMGYSNASAADTFNDVDFGIFPNTSTTVGVAKGGTASGGPYYLDAAGTKTWSQVTKCRIIYLNSNVEVYIDEYLAATIAHTPTWPVNIDCSINKSGCGVTDVIIASNWFNP